MARIEYLAIDEQEKGTHLQSTRYVQRCHIHDAENFNIYLVPLKVLGLGLPRNTACSVKIYKVLHI